MAIRSGIDAQLGAKAEATYGTYIAPDHFYEFNEFDVELNQDEIKAPSLRVGNWVQRSDRRFNNKKGVSGSLTVPFFIKGMGLWLQQALGSDVVTTPMGAVLTRRQTVTIADLFGKFLTIQAGIPDVGGVVRPFSWLGCKVTELELSQELDEYLVANLQIDGQDETTAQALASASFPTTNDIFHWDQASVNVASSAFHTQSFRVTIPAPQKTERFFLRSSVLKKEPIPNAKREITGELEGEFEDLTAYNRFVNKNVVAIDATWTGALIEGSFNFKLTVTMPACVFTGRTPSVGGTDVVMLPLGFEVLDDGTNQPITIVYDSTDTAP